MAGLSSIRSSPAYRKGLIAGLIIVVAYTLFGFFGMPAILAAILPKILSETTHRKATVREIRFHPYELSVSVRGLEIAERDGKGVWVSAEELFGNVQLASIFRDGPVLSEVRILRPYVKIVRRADGSYNFTDLIDQFTGKPASASKPLKYSLNNIEMIDGRIDFDDGPKKTRHEVLGIHLAVPFVSNLPYHVDRYVEPLFTAVVNGHVVFLKGRTKPYSDSRETAFDVRIMNLDIPHYLEYLPIRRDYEVSSAFLDVNGVVSFAQQKGKPPAVRAEGEVMLREVRVRGNDRSPMLYLPMIKGTISPSEILAGEFRLASLMVKNPEVDVAIDRRGRLNLLALSTGNNKESIKRDVAVTPPGGETPASPETKMSIEAIRLSGGIVRFSDASRATPFTTELKEVRIDVDRLSTEKGKSADTLLSLRTEAGETFDLKGTLSIAPLSSEGTAAFAKVVLKKYAPYYADAVRFDITGGILDARTGYRFAPAEGGTGLRISGLAAGLSGLRMRQREEKEEFLKIPDLSMREADVDVDRREVVVGEIVTGKGTVFIRRGPDGTMNVARLLPEETPAGVQATSPVVAREAPGKPPAAKPWIVSVRKASIDGYAVRYDDPSTDPPIELRLDRLQLRAENLTTERSRKGKFTFSTAYQREGKVSLGGVFAVNPPSLSAKLRATSLPIGPLQPYYTEKVKILLTGGTLSLDGNVSVDAPKDRPPRAEYNGEVNLNDFSSVDKERGEDFLKFTTLHIGGVQAGYNPTKVSIREIALTDFYSRIIVNPDGTLNVQGIVGKEPLAQDNAAAKVPSTPRYAGYAIQKGKLALNLKYRIEKKKLDAENKVFLDQFTFGEAVDSPDATKLPVRLAVSLLKDRKGEIRLDLPVTGQTDDPKFSVWGIVVKIIVNLLVKAATSPFALLGAMFGGGEELSYLEFDPGLSVPPEAGEGKIANLAKVLDERPGLKLEIEGHVDLEKDKEALRQIAFRRKVSAQKLKELARGGAAAPAIDNVLQVTNDDLRQLAVRRASGVRDRLLRSGKVDPERVFLVEPKSLPPERKEKIRDNRVDFRIK